MTVFDQDYAYSVSIETPFGRIVVQGTKTHIQFLKFDEAMRMPNVANMTADNAKPNWIDACRQQLTQYFSGVLRDFDLPIDPQGSDFQLRVWQALRQVSFGTIASYQQLAIDIGNANSVRAVASANARNPIWLIIPCHRIVGSDLALRGYAGGIVTKAQLLKREGLVINCDDVMLANEKTKLVTTSALSTSTLNIQS